MLTSVWDRWQAFVASSRDLEVAQEGWRKLFDRIERAWDRAHLLTVLRQWRHVSDFNAHAKWEQAFAAEIAKSADEIKETKRQLDDARALLSSYESPVQRLAALDSMLEPVAGGARDGGVGGSFRLSSPGPHVSPPRSGGDGREVAASPATAASTPGKGDLGKGWMSAL